MEEPEHFIFICKSGNYTEDFIFICKSGKYTEDFTFICKSGKFTEDFTFICKSGKFTENVICKCISGILLNKSDGKPGKGRREIGCKVDTSKKARYCCSQSLLG